MSFVRIESLHGKSNGPYYTSRSNDMTRKWLLLPNVSPTLLTCIGFAADVNAKVAELETRDPDGSLYNWEYCIKIPRAGKSFLLVALPRRDDKKVRSIAIYTFPPKVVPEPQEIEHVVNRILRQFRRVLAAQ